MISKRLLLLLLLLLFLLLLLLLLQRCFASQAILEGQSCIEYEFKCAFYVYICNVCMSRYFARRQFSYAPMDLLPFALSPILYPFPFSFFNRFFFRRHRIAPPLCLQIAQRKQCENLFANIHHPCLPRLLSSYLPLFIPLVIYVRYTRNGFPVFSIRYFIHHRTRSINYS